MPQAAVREVIEVAGRRGCAQSSGTRSTPYRGGALPIVRLGRLFGMPDSDARSRLHVFVVGAGAAALGIAVDRIVGQREIVVRAIADPLVGSKALSGATDLGDGHVVLILDPAVLARAARAAGSRRCGATGGR